MDGDNLDDDDKEMDGRRMTVTCENGRVHIKADDGKCMKHLTDDTIFVEAWLAIGDSPSNWHEIDYVTNEQEEK